MRSDVYLLAVLPVLGAGCFRRSCGETSLSGTELTFEQPDDSYPIDANYLVRCGREGGLNDLSNNSHFLSFFPADTVNGWPNRWVVRLAPQHPSDVLVLNALTSVHIEMEVEDLEVGADLEASELYTSRTQLLAISGSGVFRDASGGRSSEIDVSLFEAEGHVEVLEIRTDGRCDDRMGLYVKLDVDLRHERNGAVAETQATIWSALEGETSGVVPEQGLQVWCATHGEE